nr:hypothetical protein [Actinoplanes brasiliensis]
MLAEFGDATGRHTDAKSRKNDAGTAPITRRSGKSKTVHARFSAPGVPDPPSHRRSSSNPRRAQGLRRRAGPTARRSGRAAPRCRAPAAPATSP